MIPRQTKNRCSNCNRASVVKINDLILSDEVKKMLNDPRFEEEFRKSIQVSGLRKY